MSTQSLGLIETIGLVAAIEAADAAVKSANVDLVGYELSKGSGMTTIKLKGDVGAINAAISAGVAAASRIGKVCSHKVIARTAKGIDSLIYSSETSGVVGAEKSPVPTLDSYQSECQPEQAAVVESKNFEEKEKQISQEKVSNTAIKATQEKSVTPTTSTISKPPRKRTQRNITKPQRPPKEK